MHGKIDLVSKWRIVFPGSTTFGVHIWYTLHALLCSYIYSFSKYLHVSGDYHQYFSADLVIDGAKPKFLNDLDIAADGVIYFTDSSTKWARNQLSHHFLEGGKTGRYATEYYACF